MSSGIDGQDRFHHWDIPDRFNVGVAVADRWARDDPDRVALIDASDPDALRQLTFGELADLSNRVAAGLRRIGVERGDRVALLLPQGFEAAIAHAALYKLGVIVVPLAMLFGVEALEYRLQTAGAKAVITNAEGAAKLSPVASRLPELRHVISVLDPVGEAPCFRTLAGTEASGFVPEDTGPDDPALMIFTSGTTGPPKGALHGHRVLLGHLPGFAMAYDLPPRPGDRMWTPADWAWAGGLLNAMLPSLYHGVPVVSTRATKFNPAAALDLMQRMDVTLAFLPPTAIRMLRAVPDIARRFDLRFRAVCSAGESLGRETYEWAQGALGAPVNEMYGQTECNLVIGSAAAQGIARAGAIGKSVPGHTVALIDGRGQPVPAGAIGQIAIRRPDPVMFLGYWRNEAATAAKFIGDWMTTGDQGFTDADGYITFFGRDDDVITSAGFRIGPGEIEDCLTGHPAVALAAVVGKPDPVRTEIVKAYVVLKDGAAASEELASELSGWVRERLSAHEYPREVAFVDSIPLTTTGKVIRRLFRDRARREADALSGA